MRVNCAYGSRDIYVRRKDNRATLYVEALGSIGPFGKAKDGWVKTKSFELRNGLARVMPNDL
jgi:hypothetical protein